MFELWQTNEPAARLADAQTLDGALDRLDTACRVRHEQAAANGEGACHMRHRFEIRDAADPIVFLTYTPDADRPFESVASVFRSAGATP